MDKKSLADFTNLYSLSKTLRFELKPIGKTLENMREKLQYDKEMQTFLKDQKIEDAYQTLKPVLDKLHEDFITQSLTSNEAKQIDFSAYFKDYKEQAEDKGEKELREKIGKTYEDTIKKFNKNNKYLLIKKGDVEKKESEKKESSFLNKKKEGLFLEKAILIYIKNNVEKFALVVEQKKILDSIEILSNFFTYLGGYNQNRANYYKTEGKASQIATRIIDENLPKFCDNAMQIERSEEYKNAYKYLKDKNKITQVKDAESGEMIEALEITEEIFDISYFSKCLSQSQIEEYNRKIGHYNSLINLYNQAKRAEEKNLPKDQKTFKDLPKFKTLYKQIGCGKRKALFFALTHYTKNEADKIRQEGREAFSVEEILELAKKAGKKYFKKGNEEGVIKTVEDFLSDIEKRENYDGIYWSKKAINSLSNHYFASWQSIIQFIEQNSKDYITVASFDKKREEKVKMRDAVEVSKLFEIFEKVVVGENWWESFFRKAIWENADKLEIIKKAGSPGKALLDLLFADMRENMEKFAQDAGNVCDLPDYEAPEAKEKIKAWMDLAKNVMQMFKYFHVNESKTKGLSLDSSLSNAIKTLIFEAKLDEQRNEKEIEVDWFKWYDALRNYLTKKPQDDAKENKLKLNFENGSLLGGFVDSHTESSDNATQYGGYIFRKWNNERNWYDYLLGISQDKKLFRCHLKDEVQKDDKSDFERLEYYQAKSTTFFSEQYSENKKKLVEYLISKIKEELAIKRKLISDDKEFKKIDDLERKLLKSDTPTGLIEAISKQGEFSDIFENHDFKNLISETISEIKEHIKNYQERATKLKEIQEKNYKGYFGLKNLVDDLQTIAKEQKEYNYFPVGEKEFFEVCKREEKPLYVFKITNKDIEKKKTTLDKDDKVRQKNLHTLYFETMLAGKQSIFDIGSGEIFYRKQALKEKKIKKGYKQKPHIIEGKRFTKNQELEEGVISEKEKELQGKSFFLHLSLKLNYTKPDKYKDTHFSSFENFTNEQISNNNSLHFLGIDRGEKHLAYYSLVNQRGEIVDQGTLNLPFTDKDGNPRTVKTIKQSTGEEVECHDYNELLEARAGDRDYARKNWQTIGTIKELKEGYISQVVRKVADLAVSEEHPAFIVLEDLNTGFKRGRQKIEKSVYQKFELALAKKLNFLVDKTAQNGELGSVTRALQLTPPVQNYQDIENRKQVGIMLYTRANYTSQTDPATGWRKSIYLKYDSKNPLQFLEDFKSIDRKNGEYIFTTHPDKNTGVSWKFTSNVDRYVGSKNSNGKWEPEKFYPTEMLNEIFSNIEGDHLMDCIREDNLKKVSSNKIFEKKTAAEGLIFTINVMMQIRNNGPKKKDTDENNFSHRNDDFLHSPIIARIDEKGEKTFSQFDSRIYWEKEQKGEKADMPSCGDANGAFNIARKGFLMNEHIKANSDSRDLNLFISDEEWDLWLADKNKWQKMLPFFSSRKAMEKTKTK